MIFKERHVYFMIDIHLVVCHTFIKYARLRVSLQETSRPTGKTKEKKPMANKHCKVKNGKVGRGVKHANYILGQDKFEEKGKGEVVFFGSQNMPSFAIKNPMDFWKAADEFERKNGRVYKEIEFPCL